MAKGNMLLGQAIGSVGDITFSRVNGKQVIKSKPSTVKNPQTEAQLIQRILMNTVIQAYSAMSEICDHSFEGVSTGQDSMAYFMQRNLKNIRYQLSVTGDLTAVPPFVCPLGVNGLASGDFIIAKGSLPEIIPTVSSGAIALTLADNTYQAVIDATGAKRGDQITFITVSGSQINNQKFVYSRVILDPVDNTGESMPLSTPFFANGGINAANPRNENNGHTYTYSAGDFEVSYAADVLNMGCIIASRQKTDGSWLRSNATMLLADGEGKGYSMQEALDMFAAGGIDVENPRYLNNARRAQTRQSASVAGHNFYEATFVSGSGYTWGSTPIEIVSLVQEDGYVKAVAADGSEYVIVITDDMVTAYGKYMKDLSGSNLNNGWRVELPEGVTLPVIGIHDYTESADTVGQAEVAWLVSAGANYPMFFVS